MGISRKPKNPNTDVMTETSAGHWDFITQENLTVEDAVEYLLNDMKPRTFKEHLDACYTGNDIEKRLTYGMYQCTLLYNTSSRTVKYDSVRRKISNWINNKNLPSSREEIFQICFSLNLDEIRSDFLLKGLSYQGIHYRCSREIIYAYCLKHRRPYKDALKLVSDFEDKAQTHNQIDPVTQIFKTEFNDIHAVDHLISFLLDHTQELGAYNNTAYEYFRKMLSLLSEDTFSKHDISMKSVADLYLRMNMPVNKRSSNYTSIQKMIKKYWPDSRKIKAMKNRSEDVSRKVLLLLYLVTDGTWDMEYNELDEGYIGAADFLETHCKRMNHMLVQCGMSKIDPRNVFDYLVLYSLRPETDLSVSERMSQIIGEIFP